MDGAPPIFAEKEVFFVENVLIYFIFRLFARIGASRKLAQTRRAAYRKPCLGMQDLVWLSSVLFRGLCLRVWFCEGGAWFGYGDLEILRSTLSRQGFGRRRVECFFQMGGTEAEGVSIVGEKIELKNESGKSDGCLCRGV